MREMQAARLYKAGEPLKVELVAIPVPAANEILVQVEACGLCGTDIHLAVDGDIPVQKSPITLGHEAAGVVVEVAPGVTEIAVGDRVALFPSATCGRCKKCMAGRESLCEASKVYGMLRDGALAQYVTAPVWSVVKIPEGVSFEEAAIITDGVSTPFHALRLRGDLKAGESVAVIGCGGLGTHAILLARMMGAGFIVAIDTQEAARNRALELGADLAIDPSGEVEPRKLLRQHLGGGVDLALEFVGRSVSVNTALSVLDTGGRVVIVGVGMDAPQLPPLIRFVGKEHSVIGSFGMDKRDIEDLLTLVARGRLDLSRSISATFPLTGINEALERLASRNTDVVRLLVKPNLTTTD
jgi:D-arabinose 1-dehydrogenase-like Zn-dependent alcohol dehydrogenase